MLEILLEKEEYGRFGAYSTEEKALNVLDAIQLHIELGYKDAFEILKKEEPAIKSIIEQLKKVEIEDNGK